MTRVWLPPALQRRLRAFVTAGGTLASVGVDVVPAPGAAHAAPAPDEPDPGGERRHLRRAPHAACGPASSISPAATDKIGLFKDTTGSFTGFSEAEETTSPGTGRVLSSAVDSEGAVIIVALRVGRGVVIRFGLPELPARLGTDPNVQGLMGRTWDLLAR